MIVVDKQTLKGTSRDAAGPGWTSLRLLVKSDGMGFSMTETHVLPGTVLDLRYKNHVEACFCIGGEGVVVEKSTGAENRITPGVLYAPDAHDAHQVRVVGDAPLHLVCVFSPALQGDEVHGPDGSYASS
ncbi:MAG: ectoine synthase [Roseobacter sp.]|jgi:L-ectoine synthase|nr:ectoine synthase [Roseobacter sp.]